MRAGFARVEVTPPIGTSMTGFGGRDRDHGCDGVHDPLYARALYLSHADEQALVIGFDLLFFSRDEVDRFKGAIGRRVDLTPRQILLNTSHTHTGPKVGTWYYDPPSDPLYLEFLEASIVRAACEARDGAVEVTVRAGATRSALPMSRRLKLEDGTVDRQMRPNPDGAVCDTLPLCLLEDLSGSPVCLLFSVSCHPSTVHGFQISADFPGIAMERLDAHLGRHASLFLQGAGGDAKPSVIGKGESYWRSGTWEDVSEAGEMVANEVVRALEAGLSPVEPDLRPECVVMEWPMEPNMGRAGFEQVLADEGSDLTQRLWAQEKLTYLDRGYPLPSAVGINAHGIKLGEGLRMVGIEGEAVGELGILMRDFYAGGVTFPMGYTDGSQLYLPTSRMLDEGGYEVVSYYEYRQPARLAKGMEAILTDALRDLSDKGVS